MDEMNKELDEWFVKNNIKPYTPPPSPPGTRYYLYGDPNTIGNKISNTILNIVSGVMIIFCIITAVSILVK